jgi:hypothetical protein
LFEQIGQDLRKNLTTPYAWVDQAGTIRGYYTIACHSVSTADLPEGIRKQIPYKEAPVMLLGRLAILRELEGSGNGTLLLVDALRRCYELSGSIAATGVIVDAIDGEAKEWYINRGFIPFLDNPARLYLPMKTIKQMLLDAEDAAKPSIEEVATDGSH